MTQAACTFCSAPRENPSRALGIKPYSTQTEEAFLTTLNHALSALLDSEADYFVRREVQLSHLFRKNPADCGFFYRGSLDFVIYKKGSRGQEDAVLALELDGPEHRADPKVIARDAVIGIESKSVAHRISREPYYIRTL